MNRPANRWLVTLVCVNALLLTAVIVSTVGLPFAHAQVRPYDYLMIPMSLNESQEAVWIIDMASQQMTSCVYDLTRQRVQFGQVVNIGPAVYYGPAGDYSPQFDPYFQQQTR